MQTRNSLSKVTVPIKTTLEIHSLGIYRIEIKYRNVLTTTLPNIHLHVEWNFSYKMHPKFTLLTWSRLSFTWTFAHLVKLLTCPWMLPTSHHFSHNSEYPNELYKCFILYFLSINTLYFRSDTPHIHLIIIVFTLSRLIISVIPCLRWKLEKEQ